MRAYTRAMRFLPVAIALAVAACGQTGSLYLPDESIESPVEIRTGEPPSPAPPASTTVPSADDDKKDEKDPGPPAR
jgi:predicted small lipoprotein YifL